jgi:hypothetical protein
MGEFHYARYPETEWRKELLKMKAGGVDIVSTYLHWIIHEETEGQYNWSGQRNVRQFVQTCHELGLYVILRPGPWCHGEIRNGGFPEWMVTGGYKLRSDDPAYLSKVKQWYQAVYQQVKGQMWKDGGPVVGVQVDNEYGDKWDYLIALKQAVKEIGFDVPLYTRTSWPRLRTTATFGEILPFNGDYYAEGFWDRELTEMPNVKYSNRYTFKYFRESTDMEGEHWTESLSKPQSEKAAGEAGQSLPVEPAAYPYFICELGGGMITSYHRRININPLDVYAMAVLATGSGCNLPGYYMYHSGINPDSKYTTLNERQSSAYTWWNDMPVKTYDFQTPLGEFGQMNGHYHLLRRMHLFLRDFGSELAVMPPAFPENMPDADDDTSPRWSVRSDGRSGYVFVNNYQRLKQLTEKKGVQFTVDLPGDMTVTLPSSPVNIPSNSSFFWPFNLRLGEADLLYATAQPVARITENGVTTLFFAETDGIPAEFVFADNGVSVDFASSEARKQSGHIRFERVEPGTHVAIRLKDRQKRVFQIVLLSDARSLQCWKAPLAGKERVFLSRSGLTFEGEQLQLDADAREQAAVSVFPAPESLTFDGAPLKGTPDGVFTRYEITLPPVEPVTVALKQVMRAGAAREIKNGKAGVAEQPNDTDFEQAAVWQIRLPENTDPGRDIYLRFPYVGDAARIYLDKELLTDNFYNGNPFELGVKRFAPEIYQGNLTVRILPLRKDAPIYLPKAAYPEFGEAESAVILPQIDVYEKQSIVLHIK